VATQLTFDGEDVPHERGGQALNTADPKRLGYVGSTARSARDSDAWFTPQKYVDAARAALGGDISLDPFSSDAANVVVKAQRYLTEADNAFVKEWFSSESVADGRDRTVWMNPPYGVSLISEAISKFLQELDLGSFDRGIVLVNNATETKWFQKALSRATAITFTDHRISFWNADGKAVSGNTRGQAFLYFGENPDLFIQYFSAFGFACALEKTSSSALQKRETNDLEVPLPFDAK
jgi:phage N-6-adenine-methyltransferase